MPQEAWEELAGVCKRAVIFGLERLGPKDRFNVLSIGTRSQRLAERMLPATSENVMEASRFVNSAGGTGGTDLYNGLVDSLEQFTTRKRPCVIILAGDGRGTVGIVNPETITEDFRRLTDNEPGCSCWLSEIKPTWRCWTSWRCTTRNLLSLCRHGRLPFSHEQILLGRVPSTGLRYLNGIPGHVPRGVGCRSYSGLVRPRKPHRIGPIRREAGRLLQSELPRQGAGTYKGPSTRW